MANHSATKKDARQSAKRTERNKYYGKTTRNAIKDIRSVTDNKVASEKLPVVSSMIDKLAKRGTIHKNKAANLKSKLAKKVFAEMLKEDEAPKALVKKLGLEQVSDEGAILKLVEETIAENPQSVADYKAGKDKAIGFLVGQIMKKSRGKANPGMVTKMLKEKMQ